MVLILSAYPNAPAKLKKPVTAPVGVGPYTDSRGTFISGYAPVNMSPDTISYVTDVDGTWMLGAGRYMGKGPVVLRE